MEDYPVNLMEFDARFHSEEACREYLAQIRWPEDVVDSSDPVIKTEILTVWRRLWIELDQMAVPSYRTGPDYDGFDPAKEYSGSITNPDGSPIQGLWATYQIDDEPLDFDLAFQPDKPDISVLQAAMVAACITVSEIAQDANNDDWRTNDSNNQWDETTPFVHNMVTLSDLGIPSVSQPSRDVNYFDQSFWNLHGIGSYEARPGNDFDNDDQILHLGSAYQGSAIKPNVIFVIFQETIRDLVSTAAIVKWDEITINQYATFLFMPD